MSKGEVHFPPESAKMDRTEAAIYLAAQELAHRANVVRPDGAGIGIVLSGVLREVRRHVSLAEAQELLVEYARQMPQAAEHDRD